MADGEGAARRELIRLGERAELATRAARWFHEKWGVPLEAYRESMAQSLAREAPVPQWYLALEDGRIVGGMGVIENDFHDQKELRPNVCAVYTEPDRRGRGICGALLAFVCRDMKARGVEMLYLVTDHDSLYERFGWRFLCMARSDGAAELSRVYVHRE